MWSLLGDLRRAQTRHGEPGGLSEGAESGEVPGASLCQARPVRSRLRGASDRRGIEGIKASLFL